MLTGATGSLGRATAAALIAHGVDLVVGVRDPGAIAGDFSPSTVVALDLADLDGVEAAVARLDGTFDAVILNAAVQHRDRRAVTAQGYESTFGVNVLANALLAERLRTRTRRLVLVASGTHRSARLRNLGFPPPRPASPAVLAEPGSGSGQVAYATSKLALVWFGLEAARRWSTDVVLVDPGLMPGTGLAREYPPVQRWMWDRVLPRVLPTNTGGISTPQRSGACLAEIALDHAIPSGTYLQIDRPRRLGSTALDPVRGRELFEWAIRATASASSPPPRASARKN